MENSSNSVRSVFVELRDNIAVLALGSPDEKTAILDQSRLESLSRELAKIAASGDLRGLVIVGPTATGFSGGADISLIEQITDPGYGESLATRGQEIFNQISDLTIPTVAVIAGACVGGGCELVLACRWRVAMESLETKIGLPEVRLGIIPGFGGTQRLPRLIGLPKALNIILSGKVLPAKRAKNLGLVDYLFKAPAELNNERLYQELVQCGISVINGSLRLEKKPLSILDRLLTFNSLGRKIAAGKAKAAVLQETKGHYPAPLKALEAAVYGLDAGISAGLAREAQLLGETVVSPQSKSLVSLYMLTEAASKFGKQALDRVVSAPVAVIGGGVMGSGIASCFLMQGHPLVLVEPDAAARERARERIQKSLEQKRSLSEEQRHSLLQQLVITEDLAAVAQSLLVIEAIVEDLSVKQQVFGAISSKLPADAVIASNTSSLSIAQIASSLSCAERVIGLHFFNPAEKMPLVEVVRNSATADQTVVLAAAFVSALGKYPVIVEDVPGFLVNRILSPYIAEAGTLLLEGFSIEQIDRAAVNFGMPMGPFRLLDEVGLDVAAKVRAEMLEHYGERMNAPNFLKSLVEAGRLGKKSGTGFYIHQEREMVDPSIYQLLGVGAGQLAEQNEGFVCERLMLAMINEAVRCLDEGVAGTPGAEAAGQIDLATVMGMGFAPFRGGVLRYANSLGIETLNQRMTALSGSYGARFRPSAGIASRLAENRDFYGKISK